MSRIAYANALLADGKREEALSVYEEAVRKSPDEERGYCGAVITLLALERFEEAVPHLERLIRLRPDAAYPLGMMGCVMEMTDRPGEALACYDKMIKIDGDEVFGRMRKSLVLLQMGQTGRADECMDELAAIGPSGASAKDIEKMAGALEHASPRDAYDFDAELMPGMARMWETLVSPGPDPDTPDALSLEEVGGLAHASADPDEDGDRIRAMLLLRDGRYEEAVECLDTVLRRQPDGVADLGMKGVMLEKAGRVGEALECYDRIIEVAPGEMMARQLKCQALARRGEAQNVLECYRAAMKSEPSDANDARIQKEMRAAYSELARCIDEYGSVKTGFARFVKTTGAGPGPARRRGGAGRKPGRRRAGRRR